MACSSALDEKILYVNDTGGIHVYAFDVQADGRLANRRIFATYAGRTTVEHAGAAGVGGRWADASMTRAGCMR